MKPAPKGDLKRYFIQVFGPPQLELEASPLPVAASIPAVLSVPTPSEPQQLSESLSTLSGNRNRSFTELVDQHIQSVEEDFEDNDGGAGSHF